MLMRALSVVVVCAVAGSATASSFPGNPLDMYLTSDAANEIYQYERSSPWAYVPGTYAGVAKPQVFSNSGQVGGIGMYLGCVAGTNQDFYCGGFSALSVINSVNGTNVLTIGGGLRLGPATAPNGNIVVGGPSGTEEYTPAGGFVRTVDAYGNGANMHCFSGNNMFVTPWSTSGASTIKQFNFISGLPSGPDIVSPFPAQKLAIGPDGALYASNLYDTSINSGVYRYNGSAWTLFANGEINSGTGPHGFAWDPVSLDLYLAFQTGEIERYNGLTGAYLNQIDIIPTKLTDLLFKQVVPAPGAAGLLAIGGFFAARRRRA